LYDISFGFFYLNEFPYKDTHITDFRMNPDYQGLPKTFQLIKAINLAIRHREEIVEISQQLEYEIPKFGFDCNINQNIEEVGKRLINLFPKSCFKNKSEVNKRIISHLEKSGVYVSRVGGDQYNKVDYEEFDGAAIYYSLYPIILLNAENMAKNKNRIVFTIFHELTHLLLKNSAITDYYTNFTNNITSNTYETEVFCNKVAAAALLPLDRLKAMFDGSNIAEIADRFRVSRQVVTIRLKNISLITQSDCNVLLNEYKREYKDNVIEYTKNAQINPNIIKKRNLGDLYIDLIRDAVSSNYISYFDALKSLGMKDKAAKKTLYG